MCDEYKVDPRQYIGGNWCGFHPFVREVAAAVFVRQTVRQVRVNQDYPVGTISKCEPRLAKPVNTQVARGGRGFEVFFE